MRSLVVVEEICLIFHTRLLQSSISQLLEYNKLEVFLERLLHSIVFDRMSILSELQDRCRPNIPRLDVSSMHCARIVLDVVQRSQYVQDLHDLCLLDQWARRIPSVSCLNSDLQVSIHC